MIDFYFSGKFFDLSHNATSSSPFSFSLINTCSIGSTYQPPRGKTPARYYFYCEERNL